MDAAIAQVGGLSGLTFLMRVDVEALTPDEMRDIDVRMRRAWERDARGGRYLGPVATHDALFIEVEAPSAAFVAATAQRAGVRFDRVVECIRVTGRMRGDVCAVSS